MLKLTVIPEQARAAQFALASYVRIGEAKLDVVADMVDQGLISRRTSDGVSKEPADAETAGQIRALLNSAVGLLTVGTGDLKISHSSRASFEIARNMVALFDEAVGVVTADTKSAPAELELDIEQARVLAWACEMVARLGLCQFSYLTEALRSGEIPIWHSTTMRTFEAISTVSEDFDRLIKQAQALMGFHYGSSHGISSMAVDIVTRRCWEVRKVVEKVLAYHRDPAPTFRGVNYDGLIVRYTDDPAPVAIIAA
jgi:hypothetical protein